MEPNVHRFSGRASEYDRYLERYDPQLVLPLLRTWCGLMPQWRVADIGAGTGMLADVFLANGNSVVAVEPNLEMRTLCAHLHEGASGLEIRAGTAEATGLPDGAFDMVSAGRAMHWFDLERSTREFRRVLKPHGWVALVAFGRSESGRAENEALEDLLRMLGPQRQSTRNTYAVYQRLGDFFSGDDFHHQQIEGEIRLDWQSLRGMTISLSYAPLPEDDRFPAFAQALRALFERFEQAGEVTLATRYWIDAGRLATP